ncbi:YDG/SRA domain-containing protein [Salinimicrobium sp. CAU 1759]
MSSVTFGNPMGIEEGAIFNSRYDLIEAGLHRSTVKGIDGNGKDGAAAIVLSGGYEDDYDLGDEILYTGEGGNDTSTGKQVAHQSWNSPGNAGLLLSFKNNYPVRVIRGSNHNSKFSPRAGYKYDGLFNIIKADMVLGKSGFKICRYTLRKIGTEVESPGTIKKGNLVLLESSLTPEKWYAIGVDAPNAKSISLESNLAQKLLGRKVEEKIDFGPGMIIKEVRKYLA